MLTLLDKDGTYQLPTNWSEVTTRQFCDLDKHQFYTMEQRASYFAGRPIQVNARVAEVLAFVLYEVPMGSGLPYPADMAMETYAQVCEIQDLLATTPRYDCFADVYGRIQARNFLRPATEYSQERAAMIAARCWSFPITDTYPAVVASLKRIQEVLSWPAYAILLEPDHTEAGTKARAAGSDRLNIFGHFNLVRHYSQGLPVPDAAFQWPWLTVLTMLTQDRLQAEITDNLNRQKD